MSDAFTLALAQVNAGNDMAANIAAVSRLIGEAADGGAALVALPECVSMMEPRGRLIREKAAPEESHPALAAFCALAQEKAIWLLVGSLTVDLGADRVANRSFLIDSSGGVSARYDKIHMFDVDLPGGESYRESHTYKPGESAVLADTPWGGLGLTICYDVRFPQLYRALAKAGAGFIAVPSAFTRQTGDAHWHALLRARAIETGAFILAPAQCGDHPGNRQTFGHSLVVDPWGRILADGGTEPGVIFAEIDPAEIDKARTTMPSLSHDRPFAAPLGLEMAKARAADSA